MSDDEVNRVLMRSMLDLWRGHPPTGTDPSGRLWLRWVNLGDDPAYDDWSLADPGHEYQSLAGDHGWVADGGTHVEWCRTTHPDGPPDDRVSDWANPNGGSDER